jgi:hypothetical protein
VVTVLREAAGSSAGRKAGVMRAKLFLGGYRERHDTGELIQAGKALK